MDSIGLGSQVKALSLPAKSVPSAPASGTPRSGEAPIIGPKPDQVQFDAKTAEQNRAEALVRAAEQLANVFVIGDRTFSLFKDTTGQYITRFTSLRDGKVTYIPEPTLLKASEGSSGSNPLIKIEA